MKDKFFFRESKILVSVAPLLVTALNELSAASLSITIGGAALLLVVFGDWFHNDDDDDQTPGGGLMQPVAVPT